jgi:hypothetical protein
MDRSRQKELLEYHRTLHWLDANRLRLMQDALWINDKFPSDVWANQARQTAPKDFVKYFATYG